MTTPDPHLVSVATPMPADSHDAVDLSARASAPTPAESAAPVTEEGLHIPFITTTNEENFQDVISTSQAVPVIMVMWSPRSLESKPTLAMLEKIACEQAGKFQLVEVDIDRAPVIVQAFQIQGVPTVVALVGGRPVPLFQGAASKEQALPIVTQVLDAAAQMGVTARTAVAAEDTAALIPPEHEASSAAEATGNLDEATAGWQKVIGLDPCDGDAKSHLSRVRLVARSAQADVTDLTAHADALFAVDDVAGAFDVLLNLLAASTDVEEHSALHLRLLDLFRVAGSSPEVPKARTCLAMFLMRYRRVLAISTQRIRPEQESLFRPRRISLRRQRTCKVGTSHTAPIGGMRSYNERGNRHTVET